MYCPLHLNKNPIPQMAPLYHYPKSILNIPLSTLYLAGIYTCDFLGSCNFNYYLVLFVVIFFSYSYFGIFSSRNLCEYLREIYPFM